MPKKKLVLTFPPELTEEPLTYHLVKDFDLAINILKAKITPGEEGKLVVEISNGSDANIQAGIDYLLTLGVLIEPVSKEIVLNDTDCIHCGSCTAVCQSRALSIGAPEWKLVFDKEQCIICELCVKACPMQAIKVSF
ncbi:MAG TPA: NIL domain-containing protein [Bacillota bacterium]|nr:NIL domain-containing protein [Bacillota bacterium]